MPRTLKTTFDSRLDALIRGHTTEQLSDADKLSALDTALQHYSRDFPRRQTEDFAGDGGRYYLMHGAVVSVDDADRDASIDLKSSGADSQLAVSFTLPRRMQVHAIRLSLKRIGSPAGTVACEIRLPNGSVPSTFVAQTSNSLDGTDDLPLGFEAGKTEFTFTSPRPLNAGTYYAALVPTGYTYTSGTTEIDLGVDQSSVTNTLYTFDGTSTWTAYGTASAVIIEVIASMPNWSPMWSASRMADLPAPAITDNEVPQMLEAEDFEVYAVGDSEYLYLPNHSPASTETIRLTYAGLYAFDGSPAATNTPPAHFEAICHLAAHYALLWLANRTAANVDSQVNADIADRRSQSDIYASRANNMLQKYGNMLGVTVTGTGESEPVAASAFGDLDRGTYSERDFLYHRRRTR